MLSNDLAAFKRPDRLYPHAIVHTSKLTDGVRYLATTANAYWLVDEIVFAQATRKVRNVEFQVWDLTVTNSKATLVCYDDKDEVILIRDIGYTDFPLPSIRLFYTNKTLLLTGEV